MENIWIYMIAPVVSGLMGWFANAYRNRQRKEADQIEVARQYKALLTEALEDKRSLYQEIDKLRDELRTVREEIATIKEERTLMRLALSKAAKCEHAGACPVLKTVGKS
jgi:DNA repair exonuclease SbcCD ATPase subunit